MKAFALVFLALMAVANAMPRYLIVPIENVRFLPHQMNYGQHRRVARSAYPQDAPGPVFEIPNNLRQGGEIVDSIPAGSTYAGNAGPDYVDYGAYTGGYGAFGWYTDHPVLIQH